MLIKNKKELSTNLLREKALNILEVGYEAVLTQNILENKISLKENILKIDSQKYDLNLFNNIFVISFGKSANESSIFIENLLGNKIKKVFSLDVEKINLKKIESLKGSHPLPSKENQQNTEKIIKVLKKTKEKDLVLCFVSGGASSLLCAPVDGLDIDFLKNIYQALMDCGATIAETNIVRKHLSLIKGGALAKLAYPAKVITCVFSDVPGDDLSVVASGPTVLDSSTKEEAKMILEKYGEEDKGAILKEAISFLQETPKEELYFENIENHLLLTNRIALEAMQKKAQELGFESEIKSFELQGEASILGSRLVDENQEKNFCWLWGGESTVTLKGEGKGGRNQEFVLSALENLSADVLVLAVASDGRDNSDVAGALVDYKLFQKIEKEKIDWREYLENNNSYEFFKKTGTQIKTGKTGINIADFYMVLRK